MQPRHILRSPAFPPFLYLGLALAATRPLWLAPDSRALGLGDPTLNAYLLDWAQFAIFHQVADFFQATLYWPHADSLAYGEHLLAPAVLALPFRWAGLGATGVHNLSLVQALWFSAMAAHALGARLWGSRAGALATGLAYGFGMYRLSQLGHVQLVHGEFLPLAILAAHHLLERGEREWGRSEWRWTAALALAAFAQGATSWYWAVFAAWTFGPWFAWRAWREWRERGAWGGERPRARGEAARIEDVPDPRMRWVAVILAVMVAGVCLLPLAAPYDKLKRNNALYRPPVATAGLAARPGDFLSAPRESLPWGGLSDGADKSAGASERRLFPGIGLALGFSWGCALAFAGGRSRTRSRDSKSNSIAHRRERDASSEIPTESGGKPPHSKAEGRSFVDDFATRASASRSREARFWAVLAVVQIVFAFGPEWTTAGGTRVPLPYALVEAAFPFADTMRVPARWMLPAMLGMALVAGYGVARLRERVPEWPEGTPAAILALLLLESLTRPLSFVSVPAGPSELERFLAAQPFPSPILELPIVPHDDQLALLRATWHRQPTMNGIDGFIPPGHPGALKRLASSFPSPEALAELRSIGVRFVVIDLSARVGGGLDWDEARLAAAGRSLGLEIEDRTSLPGMTTRAAPSSHPATAPPLTPRGVRGPASAAGTPGGRLLRFGDRAAIDLGPASEP